MVKRSESDQPSEVGWESIFWGLFALAINAMSVPSILDTFHHEKKLLYPMRSSPFVCLADALDVIICVFVMVVVKRESIGNAACEIDSWQRRSSSDSDVATTGPEPVDTDPKKYPITWFLTWLVIFLGSATQVVKLFAFQGPATEWAKAAAGMYLGSYVILIAASFLPRTANYNTKDYTLVTVNWVALPLHVGFVCYAIARIYYPDGLLDEGEAARSIENIWPIFFFLFFIVVGILFQNKAASVLVIPVFFITLGRLMYWAWVLLLVRLIGLVGIIGTGLLFTQWTNDIFSWLFENVDLFKKIRALDNDELSVFYFGLVNLVVACLYCSGVYDPKGTVKPSWTERLG